MTAAQRWTVTRDGEPRGTFDTAGQALAHLHSIYSGSWLWAFTYEGYDVTGPGCPSMAADALADSREWTENERGSA